MPIKKLSKPRLNVRNNYAYAKSRQFHHERLPKPATYYATQFACLLGYAEWVSVCCCFHQDRQPSLHINLYTGAFRCFGCGIKERDIVAFHQLRYQLTFIEAVNFFGAWHE